VYTGASVEEPSSPLFGDCICCTLLEVVSGLTKTIPFEAEWIQRVSRVGEGLTLCCRESDEANGRPKVTFAVKMQSIVEKGSVLTFEISPLFTPVVLVIIGLL